MPQEDDAIGPILSLLGDQDLETVCRGLQRRFREMLLKANPDLTDAQIGAYDRTFDARIADLVEAVTSARRTAADEVLSEAERAVIARLAQSGDLAVLGQAIARLAPALGQARQTVFQTLGLEIHRAGAEAAFAEGTP